MHKIIKNYLILLFFFINNTFSFLIFLILKIEREFKVIIRDSGELSPR